MKNLLNNGDSPFIVDYYFFEIFNFREDVFILIEDDYKIDIWNTSDLTRNNYANHKRKIKLYLNQYLQIMMYAIENSQNITMPHNEENITTLKIRNIITSLWLNDARIKKNWKVYMIEGTRESEDPNLWKTWCEDDYFKFGKIWFTFHNWKKVKIFQEFSIKVDTREKDIE